MSHTFQTVRILGIDFYNDSLEKALSVVVEEGGLVLAPSGPGLAELGNNTYYDSALHNADINLIDSGYLALLWKKRTGISLQRLSGLKFIKALIEDSRFRRENRQLWVMPANEDIAPTMSLLSKNGLTISSESFYVAPFYREQAIKDVELLHLVQKRQPQLIILCVAGGKQEVLGHWLREQLNYKPAIICIGAAIAFLSGQQANIPPWGDRIYVGWLLRILREPKTYLPRYWKARKLKYLIDKHECPD